MLAQKQQCVYILRCTLNNGISPARGRWNVYIKLYIQSSIVAADDVYIKLYIPHLNEYCRIYWLRYTWSFGCHGNLPPWKGIVWYILRYTWMNIQGRVYCLRYTQYVDHYHKRTAVDRCILHENSGWCIFRCT